MPPEKDMPICPAAIIVAKPKRHQWCFEEAWDIASILGVDVHTTNYSGIFYLTGSRCSVKRKLVDVIRRYKFSFASRLIIPNACLSLHGGANDNLIEQINNILSIISRNINKPVRIIYGVRGRAKDHLKESTINNLLSKNNIRTFRGSNYAIDFEGLDNYIIVAWGRVLSCGYQCTLIGAETEILI